jgi:drug/metabolite transporter superfamily protein YnfA
MILRSVAYFLLAGLLEIGGGYLVWLAVRSVIDTLDRVVAGYRKGLGRFVPEGTAPRRYP